MTFSHGARGMGWLDPNNRTESPDVRSHLLVISIMFPSHREYCRERHFSLPVNRFAQRVFCLQLGADTKILLPAWLSEPLAHKRYVKIGVPKSHGNQTRNELKADPAVYSMQTHPFFYDIGLILVRTYAFQRDLTLIGQTDDMLFFHFRGADKSELHQVIKQTFRGRFESVLDNAQNWRAEDHAPFTETLTDSEIRCTSHAARPAIVNYFSVGPVLKFWRAFPSSVSCWL